MTTGRLVEQCGFCYNLTRGFNKFLFYKRQLEVESAAVTTKVAVRPLSTTGVWAHACFPRKI